MPNTAPIPVTQPGGACPVVFSGGVVASVHPGNLLPRRVQAAYIAILGVLTLLGSFTVDAYLPAFPQIETDLSVQPSAVQFTLTAALLGTAVGQAVVGPWSDRIGRRPPLILAAIVHVVASVGSALAQDIVTLSVSRALQGLGAAAGGVVAIALLRDLFGGKHSYADLRASL